MELCLDDGFQVSETEHIELDLSGLFRMDTKTQLETIKIGIDAAVLTPNEGRKRLNLAPLEGGDTVYMQQQNYSLAALAERDKTNPLAVQPAPMPEVEIEDTVEDDTEDDNEEMRSAIAEITKEFLA